MTGGQDFNVFNLDPFIWFIHQQLGLSAYAFALDDDIGDVGAGDADPDGCERRRSWWTAQSGPVRQHGKLGSRVGHGYLFGRNPPPPAGSSVITGLPLTVVNQITSANFSNNTPGTLVNGPGIPIGTTVLTVDSVNGTVTLSTPLTSSPQGQVTFYFFGPVVGTGTVLGVNQPKNTIQGLDMNTYDTLQMLGTLTNVQVTGPGIDPGSTVTVSDLSLVNGVPVVTLSANLDASQISEVGGSFAYTFGYATLSPIGDAGFEQPANVANLTDGFLHGTQLKPGGDQPWTFTDGDADKKIYAGIAGNGSIYTKGNGPAPQGLQVGFIQGNSSISQPVTFAAGSYQISFDAVQAADNTADQSLDVLIDGKMVGMAAITPKGTKYARYTSPVFTVTAGQHTITFQGTDKDRNTVLIDAVSFSPATALLATRPHELPVHLEFLSQPGNNVPGGIMGPVLVAVQDKFGNPWSGLTVHMTLIRIGASSRGHFVRGSVLQAKTVDGVATFDHLAIRRQASMNCVPRSAASISVPKSSTLFPANRTDWPEPACGILRAGRIVCAESSTATGWPSLGYLRWPARRAASLGTNIETAFSAASAWHSFCLFGVRRMATVAPAFPEIDYPPSDGEPMAETPIHRDVMIDLIVMLKAYFENEPAVYVSGNMMMYYVEGNADKWVSPDVFVTRGIPKVPERETYKTWVEGKGPDVVIEVTSKSTARIDQRWKFALYRDVLKVREYFLFDPREKTLAGVSLCGYRLVDGQFELIRKSGDRLISEVLGLHLEVLDEQLRLHDPQRDASLPTPQETREQLKRQSAARAAAEARAQREAAARAEAEAEVERLRCELDRLGGGVTRPGL